MTNTEVMLGQYPDAKREIKRLENELKTLMLKMQDAENTMHGYADPIKVKTYKISDPTYEAARVLCDHFTGEVKKLKNDLAGQKAIINRIDRIIENAGLDYQELDYVRYRYKQGRSIDKVCELIKGRDGKSICKSTADRIRGKALEKIEAVM
jgi:trehalose-6-phosphate synthase